MTLEAILIFPQNFLSFKSDMIEKQGIINLSSYAFVVLSDSEVAFLGEGKDVAFCPFLFCLYMALHNQRSSFNGIMESEIVFGYLHEISSEKRFAINENTFDIP